MVALFMDGKTFAADEMIIALGLTLTGEKVILGLLQTATENEKVTKEFLDQLLDRGLKIEEGLLAWIPTEGHRPNSKSGSEALIAGK